MATSGLRLLGTTVGAVVLMACGAAGTKDSGGGSTGTFPGFNASHLVLANPGGSQDFRYGTAVAWLDWNQDGRPDLVVGSPGQSAGAFVGVGAAFLYTGNANGTLTLARTFVPTNWLGVANVGSMGFGEAVATGDFDGDGRADIAIGAPGDTASLQAAAGRVYVAFNDAAHAGTLSGPFAEPAGPQAGAEFGETLAAGKLNGDVSVDLVVGAPDATVSGHPSAGRLVCLLGGGAPATWPTATSATIVSAVPTDDAFFAAAIAVGDVTGDGHGDLVVGEPGSVVGSGGAVRIVRGDGAAVPAFTTLQTLSTNEPGVQVELGSAVALGDFDHDGDLDVAAGAPYGDVDATTEAGYVIVYRATNPAAGQFTALAAVSDRTPEGGAQFGATLCAADLSGDVFADLVAGAPAATAAAHFGAGTATVLVSQLGGTFLAPAALHVVQSTAPSDDAGFGLALAAADVDGDGTADVVAIGAPGPIDPLFLEPGTVEVVATL